MVSFMFYVAYYLNSSRTTHGSKMATMSKIHGENDSVYDMMDVLAKVAVE